MKRFLRQFVAVGQKTLPVESYGQGFNYWIETRFPVQEDFARSSFVFKEVLAGLDHRALGVDVTFPFAPDSVNLCRHLEAELKKRLGFSIEVRLERGDGLVVESGTA